VSDAAGTVARVLLEAADAIAPLGMRFANGALQTLLEAGIPVTDDHVAALSSALIAVTDQVQLVGTAATNLRVAISSGDAEATVYASVHLGAQLGEGMDALTGLTSAVRTLGLAVPPETIDAIPEALVNGLVVQKLAEVPGLNELLELLGVLERRTIEAGPRTPERTLASFRFDILSVWLRAPEEALRQLYSWGETTFDGTILLQRMGDLLIALGVPAFFDQSDALPRLDLLVAEVVPTTDVSPGGLALEARMPLAAVGLVFGRDDWRVRTEVGLNAPFSSRLIVQPEAITLVVDPFDEVPVGAAKIEFIGERAQDTEPFSVVAVPGGGYIEARQLRIGMSAAFAEVGESSQSQGELAIGGAVDGGRLSISVLDADGFIGKLVAGRELTSSFAFGFGYSTSRGLYFNGSGMLQVRLPINRAVGPATLDAVVLSLEPGEDDVKGVVGIDFAGRLGPVEVSAEGLGLALDISLKRDRTGNAGPVDVRLGFKTPRGAGIAIDAGPVVGGGFLSMDAAAGRYMGALHLKIYEVSVSAFGVVDTKLPSGEKGFSFVILISAEFTPIQLGLGFTLNGVGGAIGIHRTLSKEALDGAVRSGRLEHILFPKDPAARAPEIIRDLQAYFPPAEDRYTFGPLAKIGWGTPNVLEAKLGLILELPHPVRLTLLGTVAAGLPTMQKRFVKLNLAIVGQLDFDRKTFALDASLYDSDVGGFTLSGDAAVRLGWGREPNFALAIGGFNPQFQPPAGFPALRRVAVDISRGGSPRVTCQAYLAITSNTLQVGARAELTAGGHWNIHGWIGFDALFEFQPFGFAADFSAGVALRQGTRKRASVTVHGTLKGPNPWYVKGRACISCFFFDICVGFDVTLSQKRPEALEPIPSRLDALAKAVADARNWSAELPAEADRVVSLAASDTPVVDPLGTLVVRQKEVPLGELITRFAAQALAKDQIATYRIDAVTLRRGPSGAVDIDAVREPFARAQFQELPAARKLSLPAFEPMVAGGRIASTAVDVGPRHAATVMYGTFVANDTSAPPVLAGDYSPAAGVTNALARQSVAATTGVRVSGVRKYATSVVATAPCVALAAETYAIVSTRTLGRLPAAHPLGRALASHHVATMTKGQALSLLAQHLATHPADRGELQVVSEDELAAAA
jgi:hypothetical protein